MKKKITTVPHRRWRDRPAHLLPSLLRVGLDDGPPVSPIEKLLTPRERRVLDLLIDGRSNKCMAADLRITESTVKAHVTKIMKSFCCENRTQAAVLGFCMKFGLHDELRYLSGKILLQGQTQQSQDAQQQI